VPRGAELSVALSGMDADYDLVVYSPPGAEEDPLIDLDGGLRGTPQGTLPYLPDFGLGLGRNDTRVQPTLLQDVPLQTDRRVYAASLQRGTTAERIDTPALGGGIYFIQVTGFNGAHSTKPYALRASVRPSLASPTCSTTGPTHVAQTAPAFPAAASSGATTLFVLNSARFSDTWTPAVAAPTYAELAATVAAINANPAAFGGGTAAVLDLSTKPDVVNAYIQWDAGRCEPQRANAVVKAVGGAIDQSALANGRPFDNVVLIGADDIIPMARVVDGTTLGNEREYGRTFNTNNELVSSLSYGIVLTDDPYADAHPVKIGAGELYVPDLAVGRLVEQPAQITKALASYRTSLGLLDASTAAVSGYDFLSDGATGVKDALAGHGINVNSTLISSSWTKADLDGVLDSSTSKVLSVNAHFDHNEALPADQDAAGVQSDPVEATSLTDQGGGRLLFSMGCHAGLSVSDVSLGLSNSVDAALEPDWAQQLAGVGDLLVGNTGYGYGDTDTVAASEKLMTYFAQRLDGSLTIGDALHLAKQRYSADVALVTPYDEKVLQEVVMYGLPMYRISTTAPPPPARPAPATLSVGPGGQLTSTFSVALHPGADTNPATADLVPTTTARGTFWSVKESPANLLENTDRRLTAQYRPIEPQYAVEVTPATGAAQARGALITSLTSTDVPNVDPDNFRPTIDQSADEPEPAVDDAAFPDNLGGLTTFSDAQGPRQQLILNVGQFLQNQSATGAGTQRLFTSIGGTVYYAPATNTDVTPPTITRTDAVNAPGNPATFHVTASDDAGIARVVVLSTDQATPGTWQTTELLSGGDGTWNGIAAHASTGESVIYFVQVLDTNGNVATSSNKAVYYVAHTDIDAPLVSATTSATSPVTNQDVTVTITANDGDHGTGVDSITYVRNGVRTTVPNPSGSSTFSTAVTVSAEGTATIGYSALDRSGNASASGTVSFTIDRLTPKLAATAGASLNAAGWANGAPVAVRGVQTGGSPATITYAVTGASTVPAGTPSTGSPVYISASGTSVVTFTARDAAGNVGTSAVTVRIDTAAPTIAVTTPSTTATYVRGQVVNAAYSCTDPNPGSGIATGGCAGSAANGAPIDTSTVGPHTFTVTATDVAGNVTTRSVSYTVANSNVAPVVRADWGVGARNVGFFGLTATVRGSFTDTGDPGPWKFTVDWGNGRTATSTVTSAGAFDLTSLYVRPGPFTVKITVCDAQNACGSDSTTVRLQVATSGLVPTAVCVTDRGPTTPPSANRYTGTFGWKNTQTFWIYAPVGVDNFFVALPLDRGQPTLFAPGSSTTPVTATFSVLGSGWHLGDTTVAVTALTKRC